MKEVRIGLIGTGYIGKAHAIAYAQAPTVFNLRGKLVREMVAEVNPTLAAERAQAFGFNRSTGDWRARGAARGGARRSPLKVKAPPVVIARPIKPPLNRLAHSPSNKRA